MIAQRSLSVWTDIKDDLINQELSSWVTLDTLGVTGDNRPALIIIRLTNQLQWSNNSI